MGNFTTEETAQKKCAEFHIEGVLYVAPLQGETADQRKLRFKAMNRAVRNAWRRRRRKNQTVEQRQAALQQQRARNALRPPKTTVQKLQQSIQNFKNYYSTKGYTLVTHQQCHRCKTRFCTAMVQLMKSKPLDGPLGARKKPLVCHSCTSRSNALFQRQQANNLLQGQLVVKLGRSFPQGWNAAPPQITWGNVEEVGIDMNARLVCLLQEDTIICEALQADPNYRAWIAVCGPVLKIRFLKQKTRKPPQLIQNRMKGADFPENFALDERVVVGRPNDGSLGLITFTQEGKSESAGGQKKYINYVLVQPSRLAHRHIYEMCRQETLAMANNPTAKRAGAAGGVFVPNPSLTDYSMDPMTLSKATRGERLFVKPSSSASVASQCYYKTGSRIKKIPFGVYNDIPMTRLSPSAKRTYARKHSCYRHVLWKEMEARIQSFVIIEYYDLHKFDKTQQDIWQSFRDVAIPRGTARLQEWRQHTDDDSITLWQSILLELACLTMEMRNHQAARLHEDGNHAHPVETMTLFGRLEQTDQVLVEEKTAADAVASMHDGILVLPCEGVCVRMTPGIDIVHLNLKETLHMADPSRNNKNWSKVHGFATS